MSLIGEIFKGMVLLSILAVVQQSCSVKKMANKAVSAHKHGLTEYGAYSKMLSEKENSWVKYKKNK